MESVTTFAGMKGKTCFILEATPVRLQKMGSSIGIVFQIPWGSKPKGIFGRFKRKQDTTRTITVWSSGRCFPGAEVRAMRIARLKVFRPGNGELLRYRISDLLL